MLEIIAGAALGLWFVLSVLAQFRKSATVHRWDVFSLAVPYRFFGPDPRLEDTRVSIRRLAAHGTTCEWQPVWDYQRRTLLDALWNPRRRADQAFAKDCWRVAEACRRGVAPEALETLPTFQRVLNVVRQQADGPFEVRVAIVRLGIDQTDSENVVLQSEPRGN